MRTYNVHESVPIVGMIMIGTLLLSCDSSNVMKILDVKSRQLIHDLVFLHEANVTCMMHPTTYLNKIVVGYSDGQLELWNIKTKSIVYAFKAHIDAFMRRNGNSSSPHISTLEQSPANNIIAIGFTSGDIILLNLKLDKVLFTFKQTGGSVVSLSFRTDPGSALFPYLVSASIDGRVHVWNLGKGGERKPKAVKNYANDNEDDEDDADSDVEDEDMKKGKRKLAFSIEDAHTKQIGNVHFLYGEPVMITSSADNSIKMWIFDSADGTARLLRSREGHSGHPLKIRFYGGTTNVSMRLNNDAMSCELISAGSDGTLRLFNSAIESQNREFSQKPALKRYGMVRRNEKLPVVIDFDFVETRQRDWGNLITAHKNHSNVYVWRYKHRVVSELVLRQTSWPKNFNFTIFFSISL